MGTGRKPNLWTSPSHLPSCCSHILLSLSLGAIYIDTSFNAVAEEG